MAIQLSLEAASWEPVQASSAQAPVASGSESSNAAVQAATKVSSHTTILSGDDGGSVVKRTILPGGVRVLTEAMPGQRSAAIGFWVGVGSRDEADGHYGSTHFLEHLLFKGTKQRSALDIAAAFDEVGGESNAATAKENTCYYARVLDEDLPMAIDVIADMVSQAVIDPSELESEREVIVEELAMDQDDPTDVAHEHFASAVLDGHPLGRPIGGTVEMIRSVSRDAVWSHYQKYYRPAELVITAAGGLDHDDVLTMVMQALASRGWELSEAAAPVQRRSDTQAEIQSSPGLKVVSRQVEQANIITGCQSLTATDDRRYVMSVLNAILGGGMSSRLFQEIREKRGLVYSTYSFAAAYSDAGYFGMYAGCAPSKVPAVLRLLDQQLELLATEGVTETELAKAKGQIRGGTVLAMEDTGSRMSRLGRAELVAGEFSDIDELLERIDAVTADDVRTLAEDLASAERSTVVVGPFDASEDFSG